MDGIISELRGKRDLRDKRDKKDQDINSKIQHINKSKNKITWK